MIFSLSVKDWYARDRAAENSKRLNDFIHKTYLSYGMNYTMENINMTARSSIIGGSNDIIFSSIQKVYFLE